MKKIIIITNLLLCQYLNAQNYTPKLLIKEGEIPELRLKIQDGYSKNLYEKVKSLADETIQHISTLSNISDLQFTMGVNLAFIYKITNDSNYLKFTKQFANKYLIDKSKRNNWGEFEYRHATQALSYITDMIFNNLDEREKEIFKTALYEMLLIDLLH